MKRKNKTQTTNSLTKNSNAMKTIFRSCMVAVMAMTAFACTQTDALEERGAKIGTEGQPLTFTIGGINAADQTRAIASPEEYGVDELQIFMFDYTADTPGAGMLRGIFQIDIADLTATGQYLTADMGVLSPDDYGTGDKIYYFVANGLGLASITEGATGLEVFDGTTNAATATQEQDFVNALTATLDDTGLALARPLLFSGRSAKWGLSGATTAELRRRAARFDIVNDIPEEFVIKKVEIETPAANAYIFAENDKDATRLVHSTAKYDFAASTYGNAFAAAASYVEKAGANGMEFICESAFYLYPTSVPTQTTITITADYDGTIDRQFYINQTVQILPNSRYKLVVSPDRLTFMLVLADWEEGEERPVARIGALDIEGLAVTTGTATGTLNSEAYQVMPGDNLTLSFDVTCASNKGVIATAPANAAIAGAVLTPGAVSATATRANGAAYRQSFTLAVNYATPDANPWEIVYHFTDAADGKSMGTLVLWNTVTPAASSNSYMVVPGSGPIYIPVDRGVTEGYNTMLATDAIEAEFLWTDVEGGKIAAAPVKAVTALGQGTNGYLRVEPGTVEGNALVAVEVGDVIKWSWHIWNTAYYPYDASGNAEGTVESAGKWMDRNLGATSATPGNNKTIGFWYQFGRKDPFAAYAKLNNAHELQRLYSEYGSEIPNMIIDKAGQATIMDGIQTPSVLYYNNAAQNWTNENTANDYLWLDPNALATGTDKSIFDPCPEGWHVPRQIDYYSDDNLNWSTFNNDDYGRINDAFGGFYPLAGCRYGGGGLGDINTCYWWVSDTVSGSTTSSHCFLLNQTQYSSTDINSRARGFYVRCTKD